LTSGINVNRMRKQRKTQTQMMIRLKMVAQRLKMLQMILKMLKMILKMLKMILKMLKMIQKIMMLVKMLKMILRILKIPVMTILQSSFPRVTKKMKLRYLTLLILLVSV
jgi:hypothetical protein